VKLVIEEPESHAIRHLLGSHQDQFASALVEVEVVRAVARVAPGNVAEAQRVVSQLPVVEPTETIRRHAAALDPPTLRTLDAIHLATALAAGDELDGLLTYDTRLAAAAAAHGLTVLAPS
jgi:predicted nucleic acid-binding protein